MSAVSIVSLLGSMSTPRLVALFAQDPKRAADWVYVAASEGLAQAQVCYGRMLLEGTGVAKNHEQALKWFRRGALSGDSDAINMVGRCLDNGWGAAEDVVAAAEHFQRAADLGHAWAQYNVAHMYLDGRGLSRDPALAYRYYLQAAEQQHERAMSLVGRCCEEGWGTPRNLDAAANWYRRSAEAGYFRGQYNWASILLRAGRFDEAAVWLERAVVGGTAGVRRAVLHLIARVGAPGALQKLSEHLERGGLQAGSPAATSS
jgi:TPR repeat protein